MAIATTATTITAATNKWGEHNKLWIDDKHNVPFKRVIFLRGYFIFGACICVCTWNFAIFFFLLLFFVLLLPIWSGQDARKNTTFVSCSLSSSLYFINLVHSKYENKLGIKMPTKKFMPFIWLGFVWNNRISFIFVKIPSISFIYFALIKCLQWFYLLLLSVLLLLSFLSSFAWTKSNLFGWSVFNYGLIEVN